MKNKEVKRKLALVRWTYLVVYLLEDHLDGRCSELTSSPRSKSREGPITPYLDNSRRFHHQEGFRDTSTMTALIQCSLRPSMSRS